MVIPWVGIPLSKLLETVEPTSDAKYVRFETVYAPDQMPGQRSRGYPWPYVEGLRLDEAMHDLTILATGLKARLTNTYPEREISRIRVGIMIDRSTISARSVDWTSTRLVASWRIYGRSP